MVFRSTVRRLIRAVMLSPACAGAAGCGADRAASLAPSHEEGRELVQRSLEAWKAGAAEGLERGAPPLRFVDPDLAEKAKLLEFQIHDSHERMGHVIELPVTLVLQDRRGKRRSREAVYQVATQPGLAVLRSDP